jgi:hypothetical protein
MFESHVEALRKLIYRTMADYIDLGTIPMAATVLPRSHWEALNPRIPLVIGARGSGKSFWHDTLVNPGRRHFLHSAYGEIELPTNLEVISGYSDKNVGNANSPSKDTTFQLQEKFGWRKYWQIILARNLVTTTANDTWDEIAARINHDPEWLSLHVRQVDTDALNQGKTILLVFDALDSINESWQVSREAAKELLKLCVEYRSLKSIRYKLFIRQDMANDPKLLDFPDASKLSATKVELTWNRGDLYALLFLRLANDANGQVFRELIQENYPTALQTVDPGNAWILHRGIRANDDFYKQIFELIAGKTMAGGASGHKRGFPFTWLVNHLQDGKEVVSPRSFCAALYHAASTTRSPADTPLTPKDLQEGVREASDIRVVELGEEYPWIGAIMQPMRGQVIIPCTESDIISLWEHEHTLAAFANKSITQKGLPVVDNQPLERIILDTLENLGILARMDDGRYQMPDVYRVAFGLGRKGGIRPFK